MSVSCLILISSLLGETRNSVGIVSPNKLDIKDTRFFVHLTSPPDFRV